MDRRCESEPKNPGFEIMNCRKYIPRNACGTFEAIVSRAVRGAIDPKALLAALTGGCSEEK